MDQHNPAHLDDAAAAVLDKMIEAVLTTGQVAELTDKYFTNTRKIVAASGDVDVTYAIFLRRRSIAALEPVIRLVQRLVPGARIKRFFAEGEIVPAERKLLEVSGKMSELSEVETLMLQKTGFPCISASNAYEMCRAVPYSSFLDMHARHGSGAEMNILAAYGAAVGSRAARMTDPQIKGFIGSSQDLTSPLFGAERGLGTMPHALVGHTDADVLEATKRFARELPEAKALIALVDYRGHEVADSLRCAKWFFEESKLHEQGKMFGVRLDTHGARFAEGLDYDKSVELVGEWLDVEGEYNIVEQVLGQQVFQLDFDNIIVDRARRILFGAGVSVASIIHIRRVLDDAGYPDTQIVASSGFGPQKCVIVGKAKAPVDMIGTGSFLPATLTETYATADIIRYDGVDRVKTGREFLLE